MSRLSLGLIAIPIVLALSGCLSRAGFPKRPESVRQKLSSLQNEYFLPAKNVLKEYKCKPDPEKRAYRDTIVYGRMLALDMQYGLFKEAIYEEGVTSNLAIDILGVAVGAAGAAVTGADASRILSALSGGISGTGTAINKNLYYERTLPALLALMDAKRDEIRAEIIGGLTLDHLTYPLGRALTDLERYLHAGSIPGAIADVIATAGETKANAEAQISIVRSKEFVDSKAQERIDKLLEVADQLPENAALRILKNPPAEIDQQTLSEVKRVLGDIELKDAFSSKLLKDDDQKAKQILKMVLVLMATRDEENVTAWKAAMVALMKGE